MLQLPPNPNCFAQTGRYVPAATTPGQDYQYNSALLEEIKRLAALEPKGAKVLKIDGEVLSLCTERPAATIGVFNGALGAFKAVNQERPQVVTFSPLTPDEETALIRQSLPAPAPRKHSQMPSITFEDAQSHGLFLGGSSPFTISPAAARLLLTEVSFGFLFSTLNLNLTPLLMLTVASGLSTLWSESFKELAQTKMVRRGRLCIHIGSAVCTLAVLKLFVGTENLAVAPEAGILLLAATVGVYFASRYIDDRKK
jgi:hypothetical protein